MLIVQHVSLEVQVRRCPYVHCHDIRIYIKLHLQEIENNSYKFLLRVCEETPMYYGCI